MNKEEWTVEAAMGVVDEAGGCEDHRVEIPFTAQDVDAVLFYEYHDGDCAEHDSATIVRLKSGKYVYATESCDTSGHG